MKTSRKSRSKWPRAAAHKGNYFDLFLLKSKRKQTKKSCTMLLSVSDVETVSFSHDSLGRGGGGDDGGGGGSCPGTPEMRRRQEEVLRRLAGQVRPSRCERRIWFSLT